MNLGLQRGVGFLLCLAATAASVFFYFTWARHLPRVAYLTGWLLLLAMVVLTLFNGRKKLPFLPIGTARGWLQWHIYVGLFTGVLFVLHLQFHMPTGPFEQALAVLFMIVMVSGVVGLFLSRHLPKRLTTSGAEIPYDRIPLMRRQLQQKAEALALASIQKSKSSTIAEYYSRRLVPFFNGPRNFWLHLVEVRRPVFALLKEIRDLNRYVSIDERESVDRLSSLVTQKDILDYHYALQKVLKGWLFVHIPFTYSLLLFTLVHMILVFAFSGGAR